MTHARELPADDPDAVRQAVTRAAAGEHVRLVAADGRRVADVIPPTETSADQLDETAGERADRATEKFLDATGGTVTLDSLRRVYDSLGQPWPGDAAATTMYAVRPAS